MEKNVLIGIQNDNSSGFFSQYFQFLRVFFLRVRTNRIRVETNDTKSFKIPSALMDNFEFDCILRTSYDNNNYDHHHQHRTRVHVDLRLYLAKEANDRSYRKWTFLSEGILNLANHINPTKSAKSEKMSTNIYSNAPVVHANCSQTLKLER